MAENDAEDLELEDPEDAPEIGEGEEDKTDYKALAIKNAGIAKRNKTKLEKLKLKNAEKKGEEKAAQKQEQKGFGYAELAYLTAKGIVDDDEVAFTEKTAKDTGKELRDLLGTKWFQEELKEMRDAKAAKDAVPSASKRSTSSSRDSVEYWIAKGELPPPDQVELRRKVVNAKIKQEKDRSTFTDRPVV